MAQTDDQEDLEEGEVITRSYPTEEDLLGLRTTPFQEASPYTKHLWLWYAGQALNAIPSRWNKARTNTLLHEAMTVSDEAFIITIIVAYEDKWKEAIETPRTARAGRRKGEKWNEQIIKRFTKYYNSISQARQGTMRMLMIGKWPSESTARAYARENKSQQMRKRKTPKRRRRKLRTSQMISDMNANCVVLHCRCYRI